MADVVGIDSSWIPKALRRQTATKMTEADWTLSGIGDFVNEVKKRYGEKYPLERFGVNEIVEWAALHETHSKNRQLNNSWSLSKYFRSHRGVLLKAHGIYEVGKHANRQMYSIK